MARSSTTRHGNGAGYGGPKNGEGKKPGNTDAGRPEGVKNGEGKAAKTRELLEAAAPMAIQRVISIAKDAKDMRSLAAAFGILNRVGLHEKSGVEHSGEGGGSIPLSIGVTFVEPKRDDT